jgi:hypothetical protein
MTCRPTMEFIPTPIQEVPQALLTIMSLETKIRQSHIFLPGLSVFHFIHPHPISSLYKTLKVKLRGSLEKAVHKYLTLEAYCLLGTGSLVPVKKIIWMFWSKAPTLWLALNTRAAVPSGTDNF